jgi:peptidylprolyl isomerase
LGGEIKMKQAAILLTFLAFLSASVWAAQEQTTKPVPAAKAGTTRPKPAAQMTTTPSGLQYRDVVVGKGAQPKEGDTVVVNYTGRFTNGKIFDTSVGKRPFEFKLGRGEVIKGWDEGVASMHVGGKRKLVIPPDLAYGAGGYPGVIPPNSTLTFDVELLNIK